MKKDVINDLLRLQKLTIAKLDSAAMHKIHGGDCLPTEHYDEDHTVSGDKQSP
ncbi:class I lanthipeptide [Sungkyunkwania multivorans]|uniref:Class I lanthipeptide n=1 Tax=Sungkyunkwania multivorans TaxID=1173618 RepID=A0ABW3CZC3_9FLAO